jgi:hypothetical protein
MAALTVGLRPQLSHCAAPNSVDLALRISLCRFEALNLNALEAPGAFNPEQFAWDRDAGS